MCVVWHCICRRVYVEQGILDLTTAIWIRLVFVFDISNHDNTCIC